MVTLSGACPVSSKKRHTLNSRFSKESRACSLGEGGLVEGDDAAATDVDVNDDDDGVY